MQLNPEKLKRTIELARNINEYYANFYLNPRTNVKSTDYLRDICEKYLEKKIEIYRHKMPVVEGQPTKGFYFSKTDGSYEVALLTGLNYCWRRLVLCKELFHVVLDEEESRHETVEQLIDETAMHINLRNNSTSIPFQTELLAEIAAMEFLFPYAERSEKIKTDGAFDSAVAAEQYKIPRFYVELYLSDSFMSVLKDF